MSIALAESISIELLIDRPELVEPVGEMRWRQWGHAPEPVERDFWVGMTRVELGRDGLPLTWVAVDAQGRGVGAVGLAEFDIEECRDRSPWVIGMIVAPELRGQGIGRMLLGALEDWARSQGWSKVWAGNEGPAVDFYKACGWELVKIVQRAADERMRIFSKEL